MEKIMRLDVFRTGMLTGLFFTICFFSSSQIYDWVATSGGGGYDKGQSINVDVFGNVIITGYFEGTADFDPGPGILDLTSVGDKDIFIQKLDPNGNLLWAKSVGSIGQDMGLDVTTDPQGNVYTTGYFSGSADFDPGLTFSILTSAGGRDVFVQKLDPFGTFVWAKNFGTPSDDQGKSIAINSFGDVITTGDYEGSGDFDPGPGSFVMNSILGLGDVFIHKLSSTGNFMWAKSFGGNSYDSGNSLAIDAAGNIYTVGSFSGSIDLDPSPALDIWSSAGGVDAFIQKLDNSGNYIWGETFGGTDTDMIRSIAVDQAGWIYTTGYFNGITDLNPDPLWNTSTGSMGGSDVFVQKLLSSSGALAWFSHWGGSQNDYGESIALLNNNKVAVTGFFRNSCDFDAGPGTTILTAVGQSDAFISIFETTNNTLYNALSYGGVMTEDALAVATYGSGIYTTGTFFGTADFDPNAPVQNRTSVGIGDAYVLKLLDCPETTETLFVSECSTYTVPSGDETYTASGIYSDTIPNACGGDSVLTISLTIGDFDPPSISCPGNLTLNNDPGQCNASNVAIGTAITSDNCSSLVNPTNNAPTVYPIGTTTVVWTATDGAGNTSTCSQDIVIIDAEVPLFTNCPSNISITANLSGCSAVVNWTAPTVTDNCNYALISSHNPGDTFPEGPTTVTYTATDVNGNIGTCSFNIQVMNSVDVFIEYIEDVTCFGLQDGTVHLGVNSSSGSLQFDWSNDGLGDYDDPEDINVLSPGIYSVSAMDSLGCILSIPGMMISEPDTMVVTLDNLIPSSACGISDGEIHVTVSGGNDALPYTYDWDNDGVGDNDDPEDLVGVSASAYNLIVMDLVGCTATFSATLSDPGAPVIQIDSTINVQCNGMSNGAIYSTMTSSAQPLSIDWSNDGIGDGDDNEDITGLASGTYFVTATDVNGCVATSSATVIEPAALAVAALVTDEMLGNDASIDITASGGTPPYTYDWDIDGSGDFDDTEDQTGLIQGSYILVVMDANGCISSNTYSPGSQVSLSELPEKVFRIYPNPSNGVFNLEMTDYKIGDCKVHVHDIQGKLIEQTAFTKSTILIDLTWVQSGAYIVTISAQDILQKVKIIKE